MDIDISLNKNNMEDLLVMLSGFNKESTDSSFEKIAKTLFGDYHIQKGTKTYELMEIEFYLFSERHKDIITYPRKNDKAGMWFFHMSGVDITFGTTDKNVYGGILIRSIIRTDEAAITADHPNNLYVPRTITTSKGTLFNVYIKEGS